MKVLIIGNNAREHALAWKISQSPLCTELYCTPGNAGTEDIAICHQVAADDINVLVELARTIAPDLVIPGPEAPLVLGITDRMREIGIPCFGPDQAAAQLEGSKAFTKDICAEYGIPTAMYKTFSEIDEAFAFLDGFGKKVVIKADGLAAGKGVIIPETKEEAKEVVAEILSGESFGDAGKRIVIEEFLEGEELSFFAISDGETVLPLATAQDHKRAFDDDKGPNTGGMGAYSPARMDTPELQQKIMDTIIHPTLKALKDKNIQFQGVLYVGLIMHDGEPKLIEYNVRFGDPEFEPVALRMEGDLLSMLNAATHGRLNEVREEMLLSPDPALCVVYAANGYPGQYKKDTIIRGVDCFQDETDIMIFQASTRRTETGETVNSGGRTLCVTAKGPDFKTACAKAYDAVSQIDWPQGYYRKDIGRRVLLKNAA